MARNPVLYSPQFIGRWQHVRYIAQGGTVIDPSCHLNEVLDVRNNGKQDKPPRAVIPQTEARHLVDVAGKIVAPGFIDIHTHIYHPGRNWNHPDVAGVRSGVTTIADAGGPGSADFADFVTTSFPKLKPRSTPSSAFPRAEPWRPTQRVADGR